MCLLASSYGSEAGEMRLRHRHVSTFGAMFGLIMGQRALLVVEAEVVLFEARAIRVVLNARGVTS